MIQEGGSKAFAITQKQYSTPTTVNISHGWVRNYGCKEHWIMDLYFSNKVIFGPVGHMTPEDV